VDGLCPSCQQRVSTGGGFVIPPGKFTKHLTSENNFDCSGAIRSISQLAQSGNRSGLDELENVIRENSPGRRCDFCRPGVRTGSGGLLENAAQAMEELIGFARNKGLLSNAREVGALISVLDFSGFLPHALNLLRDEIGFRESRSLELLFAQITINTKYRVSVGELEVD
jgi:hypothetical protein